MNTKSTLTSLFTIILFAGCSTNPPNTILAYEKDYKYCEYRIKKEIVQYPPHKINKAEYLFYSKPKDLVTLQAVMINMGMVEDCMIERKKWNRSTLKNVEMKKFWLMDKLL